MGAGSTRVHVEEGNRVSGFETSILGVTVADEPSVPGGPKGRRLSHFYHFIAAGSRAGCGVGDGVGSQLELITAFKSTSGFWARWFRYLILLALVARVLHHSGRLFRHYGHRLFGAVKRLGGWVKNGGGGGGIGRKGKNGNQGPLGAAPLRLAHGLYLSVFPPLVPRLLLNLDLVPGRLNPLRARRTAAETRE
ncbi:hypothetical protein PG996_003465 [Apiospora saccharicola]|uniref:Uncharacterized protein n=1 Tax=Apiospora saccharicola TaxID=335842 RepID=A0ABR1W1D4_9PEZI